MLGDSSHSRHGFRNRSDASVRVGGALPSWKCELRLAQISALLQQPGEDAAASVRLLHAAQLRLARDHKS